jgi:hypothetical protein
MILPARVEVAQIHIKKESMDIEWKRTSLIGAMSVRVIVTKIAECIWKPKK